MDLLSYYNLELKRGIHLEIRESIELFDTQLGILVLGETDSIIMLCINKYYQKLSEITEYMEPSEVFEAGFISVLENIVSNDFLLLSGPYHVFMGQYNDNVETLKPNYNLSIIKNDYSFLEKYCDFNQAVQPGDSRDFLSFLLTIDGNPAGIVTAIKESEKVYSLGAEISMKYRNMSLGTFLISSITNYLIDGGNVVYYQTSISNIASIKMALKSNYKLIATTMYTV
jgi:hypothetical protein